MSTEAQTQFECLVAAEYERWKDQLDLAAPRSERDGFITRIVMAGTSGFVELRCGPAEYHAEMFIYTVKDAKRWDLTDLIGIPAVHEWLTHTSARAKGKARLEAEVEAAFCLLVVGLRGIPHFEWLHRSTL